MLINKINKIFVLLFLFTHGLSAQISDLNITQLSNLPYTQELNDIWGYEDELSNQYALVGTYTGTSIVDVTNPANPVEILFIPGANSIWRDIKTHRDFAYVTCDQGMDGLLIINLDPLPAGTPTYQFYRPELTFNGDTDTLNKAHNLYIDENGYCYISGSNISSGETFILDVFTNPGSPIFKGATLPIYAHDAYSRGDTLWTSDINAGKFSCYDVSDKLNPALLADQSTPMNFCHNAWISDDGNTLFTTDEKQNAWIGSYDVSDLSNIKELDRWKTKTPGTIPHNVHTYNDYLVISYYTDGIIILDASRPDNLIEVGRYDTYFGQPEIGFYGSWGAYPFASTGLIYASDINTGLHVLQPNYVRGCWLEGTVYDQSSSNPVFDAEIKLVSADITKNSNINGIYKTGVGIPGTYTVEVRKAGYVPSIVQVNLVNGQLTLQDFYLTPAVPFTFSGQVVESANPSTGIPNAQVMISSSMYDYNITADANGNFSTQIFPEVYEVIAGEWGYRAKLVAISALDSTLVNNPVIDLDKGYHDDFVLDLGWSENGSATTGRWERGIPENVSTFQGNVLPEEGDMSNDLGEACLITGNNGNGQHGLDDIDNGFTRITSPSMDLTSYSDPKLKFNYFMSVNWPPDPLNKFEVTVDNGSTTAVIFSTSMPNYDWSPDQIYHLNNFITLTNDMTISFTGNDSTGTAFELLVDMFEVYDTLVSTPIQPIENSKDMVYCYPNPFKELLTVEYDLESTSKDSNLELYNSLGACIYTRRLKNRKDIIQLNLDLSPGIYLIKVNDLVKKIIKE